MSNMRIDPIKIRWALVIWTLAGGAALGAKQRRLKTVVDLPARRSRGRGRGRVVG